MMAMINFLVDLSGTKVLKNGRLKKLLPFAWNNGGTGVLLRMKKRNRKTVGIRMGLFCV